MEGALIFISDIHGNKLALQAVLEQLKGKNIYCLGDIVGYGPRPAGCVEIIRNNCRETIQGNHDAAVTGQHDYTTFTAPARRSTQWTRKRLNSGQLNFLRNLPLSLEKSNICLYHGSPAEPLRRYVETPADIQSAYHETEKPDLLVLGHTHKPYLYLVEEDELIAGAIEPGERIELPAGGAVMNPGSVGQPRDGDSRAAYACYWPESKEVSFYRVQYDIEEVCELIEKENLPDFLCERLREGY
ncbi:MAG: metallophosphoesterase family protein [bacterium]